MKRSLTALLFTSLVVSQLLWPISALAAASLYFSGNGAVKVGQTWSVAVLVSTSQPVNAVDLTVTFPSQLLEVTTVDGSGSKFPTDGPGSPAIDNGAGKVQIIRYALSGYNGGAGKIATIVFKAKASGKASLGFGVSKVIAHDGQGTNVYSGGGSAAVTISSPTTQPTPTPAKSNPNTTTNNPSSPPPATNQPTSTQVAPPAISSASHPDQNAWYQAKQLSLAWTDPSQQASGYNVEVNNDPATQLAEKITHTQTKLDTQLAGDGVWYAHVRSQTSSGWSVTSHYKIQLDTQAPGQPTIKIDPDRDIRVRPQFTFSATDATSAIAQYQIQFDDGQWQKADSPYKPRTITAGPHIVAIKAFDQAGNTSQTTLKFTIAPLDTPSISQPSQSILALGNSFKVAGHTSPGLKVEIYVNGQLSETVQADDQGNYSGTTDYFRPDHYTISVKAINADGITSHMSPDKHISINGLVVLGVTLPNWLTYMVLVGVLTLLLGVIVFLAIKLRRLKSSPSALPTDQVEASLDDLEKALDHSIDQALADSSPQSAQQIKDQLASHIDKLEQTIMPTESSQADPSLFLPIVSKLKALPATLRQKLSRPAETSKGQSQAPSAAADPLKVAKSTSPEIPAPLAEAQPVAAPVSPQTTAPLSPVSSPTSSPVVPTISPPVSSSDPAKALPDSPPTNSSPAVTPAAAPPIENPPPQPVAVDMPTDAFDAVIQAEKDS